MKFESIDVRKKNETQLLKHEKQATKFSDKTNDGNLNFKALGRQR